jgi:hypothetical protein
MENPLRLSFPYRGEIPFWTAIVNFTYSTDDEKDWNEGNHGIGSKK